MTARAAVHTLVSTDVEIGDIGVQNTYAANSVDSPPEELFVIIKWEPTTKAFKKRGIDRVTVWVHDRQRDYGRIDSVLARLKDLLPDAVHVAGTDGWTLTTADWLGEGPDLFDSGYQTVTRWAEFSVVSRYTASG